MALPDIIPIPPRVKDHTGARFGRLTVLGFIGFHIQNDGHRRPRFLCLCDCGNPHEALSASLVAHMVKSCGCLASENGRRSIVLANAACDRLGRNRFTTHGLSKTAPEYYIWASMKQRCFNPKVRNWLDYGGRGITVCERWRGSFEAFYADMGTRPTPAHSIERQNVDGNYEPGNVVWATSDVQFNNRRDTKWIVVGGRRMSLADAERQTGISQKTLRYRLDKGWPESELFAPVTGEKRIWRHR